MSGIARIDREAGEALFARFAPMFAAFEERDVDYCLVGGLAIVAHCLARGSGAVRATEDADALVPGDYSNVDFARQYLAVYAADARFGREIYDALLGPEGLEGLSGPEDAFVNISFVGAVEELDGVDTPDFDVCRVLNGRTLASIERERLDVCGQRVWVATVGELLSMKRETAAIYGGDPATSPRRQDFVDIGILEGLDADAADGEDGAAARGGLLARVAGLWGGLP